MTTKGKRREDGHTRDEERGRTNKGERREEEIWNKWREEETIRGEEKGRRKKGRRNNGRRKKDTDEAQTRNKTETDRHRQTDRQNIQNTKVPRPKVAPSLSSPMVSIANLPEWFPRGLLVQFVPTEWGRLTCTNRCLHQIGRVVDGSILLHIV